MSVAHQEGDMLPFRTHPQAGQRTARLEQRMTPETKELIERAARLQGVSASDFLLSHAATAARETISRLEVTALTPEDHAAFNRAADAEPTRELLDLMQHHAEVTSGR
jgi:uncharacterized protein (DUF1778 family)